LQDHKIFKIACDVSLNWQWQKNSCSRHSFTATYQSKLCIEFDMLQLFLQLWLWKAYQATSFYIVNPKATYHITRQASINARASVR